MDRRPFGICLSDKKFHKLRWDELAAECRKHGYEPRKLDAEKPLREQGPLRVFVHKLTDVLASAEMGDQKCKEKIKRVEQYIQDNPDMIVIDPIDNVRVLLDRYKYYSMLEMNPTLRAHGVVMPPFCILTSGVQRENVNAMKSRSVTFPVICKTLLAHGAKSAHRMSVIFNEEGLTTGCSPPCVVQSFVNHNAVLYKVYLVGNRYCIFERPSLKNFYPSDGREPIHFDSHEVCKADSQSTLSILDPEEAAAIEEKPKLDLEKVETILKALRKELNLVLFGVDIVVDNRTNIYAIIDINIYPGYEGFPNFYHHLLNYIDDVYGEKTLNSILLDDCKNNQTVQDRIDRQSLINIGDPREKN